MANECQVCLTKSVCEDEIVEDKGLVCVNCDKEHNNELSIMRDVLRDNWDALPDVVRQKLYDTDANTLYSVGGGPCPIVP